MALDPNIALSYRSPKIKSPLERESEQLRLSVLRAQSDDINSQRAMREELATLGDLSDPERVAQVMQKYDPFKAQAIRASASQAKTASEKANLEREKENLNMVTKKLDLLAQSAGFVMQNPTPENAMGAIDRLERFSILTPEQAAQARSEVPDTPEGIANWARGHYQSSLNVKDQLPKFEKFDTGGQIQAMNIDPITGKPSVTGRFDKTATPEALMTDKRAREEGAASRAVTIRGQNMADARAREASNGSAKAPTGYRFKQDGTLEAIPGGPADIKAGEVGAKAEKRTQAAARVAKTVISKIDDVIKRVSPITAGTFGAVASKVPGTSAYDIQADLDTIRANFGFDRLQEMRDMSPTGGALGQVAVQELSMLQSSVANLDKNQSPSQLKKNLQQARKHYENWLNVIEQSDKQQIIPSGADAGTITQPSVSNW